MKDLWRAILIVQKEDAKKMDLAIQWMFRLGITTIHIFAEAGVRISQRYDHALHQDSSWDCPYKLWKGAAEIAGNVYSSESELFLVSRPGCYFWEQLLVYCEKQVNRKEVAVWCPLTPNRVFPDANIVRPRCKGDWGWCPTQVQADVEMHHCFVVTGHVLSLMGFYLPPNPDCAPVGCSLAYELGRRGIPYMFHMPSLVDVDDINVTAADYVSSHFSMNQKEMGLQSFISEPIKRKA